MTSIIERLEAAALALNTVSDELTAQVALVDAAMKKLNLGVAVWLPVVGHPGVEIGYARVDGWWGVALRQTEDAHTTKWRYGGAPRALRLVSIGSLGALFDAMEGAATQMTGELREKSDVLREAVRLITKGQESK